MILLLANLHKSISNQKEKLYNEKIQNNNKKIRIKKLAYHHLVLSSVLNFLGIRDVVMKAYIHSCLPFPNF